MNLSETITSYKENPSIIRKPYIIAEAGVNHEGSMDLAKRLIEEAQEGGAHAIKFQTYKAEKLASRNSPSYWDLKSEPTLSQFELFKKYDKFWKGEYEQLKQICDEQQIEFLSTPFDVDSAEFLNDLMEVFKISSSDLNNLPFIDHICQYQKPIILSTGAATLQETKTTHHLITKKRGIPCALLHCILNYPTDDSNANLGMILDLKKNFPNTPIGYSDHTLPKNMEMLKLATILGAFIQEKHFTFDKTLPGNDHYHAMDKHDLNHYHKLLDELFSTLGSFEKIVLESENISRKNARRSLVAARMIKKDNFLQKEDLTWKRPGTGISPEYYHDLVGKRVTQDIDKDEILTWNKIEK